MRCDYCFYRDEMSKRKIPLYGFMSEETLKNVIRKTMLTAEGMITYVFQGGEPTLCGIDFFKKVLEYQKKYNKYGIQVQNTFQTNGYAIDKDWCSFLTENNFLVGVSVDGTKETHDYYRHDKYGNGTYGKVRQSIKMFDEYGVEYNVLTVVHNKVAENIKDIYFEYKRNGWNYQQYIPCLEPLGKRNKEEYALSPEQYGKFLIELFEMWYSDVKNKCQPYIRHFENYIAILLGYCAEACDQRGRCSIQNVIEADGSVYPCDFYVLDTYKLGNLNNERMMCINNSEIGKQFIQRSLVKNRECMECKYYSLCKNGCFRHRDFVEVEGSYKNFFCTSYKIFFENCYEKLKEIADLL